MAAMTIKEYVQQQLETASTTNFCCREAEMGVIGGILKKGRQNKGKLALLTEEEFSDDLTRKLFSAIKAAAAKGLDIDFVTTDATYSQMYPEDANELTKLMLDCNSTGTSVFIDDYIHIVKELAARRRSIAMVEDITARLKDPTTDLTDVIERMRRQTTSIATTTHTWESMSDVLIATFEKLEQRAKGSEKSVTTGIRNIDQLIGGFYPGELTIIGARPAVGKSAFGANIALAAARDGMKVGIASREMTNIQFGQRLLAHSADIDGMKLRKAQITDEDWGSLADGMERLAGLPVSFMFSVTTVEDLRIEVQQRVEKKELDLLIVDYLQLMRTTQRFPAEYLRVAYISRTLKDMALDFQIPIVALAQVSRDTDGQMPSLKSLKDSGAIEQDADGVIFLHRPMSADDPYVDKRDRESFHDFKKRGYTYICIGVAKQRQGTVGQACVLFDSKHMRYLQIAREEPPTGPQQQNGGKTDNEQSRTAQRPMAGQPYQDAEQLSISH